MKIGERIRQYRQVRGLSQPELGDRVGVGQTTISSWERGRTVPTREMVVRVADALGVPPTDIERLTEEASLQFRFKEVPVISWVSAGRLSDPGQLLNSSGQRLLLADLPAGEYFATDVRGDSMDRISPEGSRLIVNAADRTPVAGRYYIFSLRGETTFKRYADDPVVRFEPFSTNPANQIIFAKSDSSWMTVGRVVRSFIDLG